MCVCVELSAKMVAFVCFHQNYKKIDLKRCSKHSFLYLSAQIHTLLSLFLKVEKEKCYFYSQVGKLEQKCSVCWLRGAIGGGPNRQIYPASEGKRTHLHTQACARQKQRRRGETEQSVNQSWCCSLCYKRQLKTGRKSGMHSVRAWTPNNSFSWWFSIMACIVLCVCVCVCNPLWMDKFRRSEQGQCGRS